MSRGILRAGAILAAFLIPLCAARAAEPPHMVADLNTQPVNGSALPLPDFFDSAPRAELGGILYFAAVDPMHGQELWRSDGTPGGTRLVRDIRPGRSGSRLNKLIVHQGRLYFFADDGVWGLELWSSDGSREGTRLVRDVCPGSCWANYEISHQSHIESAGTQLFFLAGGQFGDLDLWRTDGTREGTRRVIDTCPGCSNQLERDLTPLPDGRLFFTAVDPQKGFELWVSDGTPGGTRALDLAPGLQSSGPSGLTALGDRLLFWTYYFPTGQYDLWVSDGTPAGSRVVRSSLLPPSWENPVVWKGAAYFANNFGEFWRTDGTSGGTVLLRTFDTGQTSSYHTPNYPTQLTPLRDSLLFIAWDPARGTVLWQTRGTPATTQVLRDPAPGADSPDLAGLQEVGNRAFFFTRRAEGPFDLWVSNGKVAGTRRVTTLCATANDCFAPGRFDLLGVGGLAFFPVHSKGAGSELWRSDGSAAGTFEVRDIHSGPGSSALGDIAALDGRAVFAALVGSPSAGTATLFSSDGTAAGTVLVEAHAPWPQDFVRQGDHLYFSGGLTWSTEEPYFRRLGLWRTDGTPAGTELLAGDLFQLDLLGLDGGLLYLAAADDEYLTIGTGVELWRSDGTRGGTLQVADLDQQLEEVIGSPSYVIAGSSDPGPPVRLGPVLLFAADDGLSGRELWATDGTEAGTRKVRDINQQDRGEDYYFQPGESYPESLVRLGGKVLFVADDGLSGRELWVTDGTEAGTRLLRDLRPGTVSSLPHDLVELGGAAYFFASAGGTGEALWRSDGTEAGTVQVKSLVRQGLPSWGRTLTRAGNRLFFVADNEAIGSELHVTDGTLAGTRLVRQIRAGVNGSYPQSFKVVDGVLIFAADDGAHGLEPWRSDGTAAGTKPLGDLAPGQAASAPATFTDAGSLLFFAADDGVHGRELWTMDLP